MVFDYNQPYIPACLFAVPRCPFCWSYASSDYSPVLSMGFRIPLSFVPRCHLHLSSVAYPGIFLGGGVQQIQLRTESRENGNLGVVAP